MSANAALESESVQLEAFLEIAFYFDLDVNLV